MRPGWRSLIGCCRSWTGWRWCAGFAHWTRPPGLISSSSRPRATAPTLLRNAPCRLRQVLTNLVGNALKFTASGEVAIRVAVESQDDRAALLRFSVRDTGIGIPADKLDMLFDKFTQVDASTTRRYGGAGLGPAISKQLVGMMRGEIGVTSVPGQGSEFRFSARFEKQPEAPLPAVLDWMTPLIIRREVARRILALETDKPPYLHMPTGKGDIIAGLDAGATATLPSRSTPASCALALSHDHE